MKVSITKILCAVACLFVFSFAATAQQKAAADKRANGSAAGIVLRGTGKLAAIVVGSAANSAWATTKFVTKHAIWPVAKTALLKVPKQTAVLGLKTAGFSLRKGIPAAGKAGLAYLKTKIP